MAEKKLTAAMLSEEELEAVSGGELKYGQKVDQYDVRPGNVYWIYFPMQQGPFVRMPYGKRSGSTYLIMVYEVYEAPGLLWGTNRTIKGVDMNSGEYVTVCINANNVNEVYENVFDPLA